MVSLYYDEIMEKIGKYEGKRCLDFYGFISDKVLGKIKKNNRYVKNWWC